jgi:peroxiredoxin
MEQKNANNQNLLLLLIGAGLVSIVVVAFLALPKEQANRETANLAAAPREVNFLAPNIKLTDLHGNPVAFFDYKGQVILYNAWATWCLPCEEEMPALEAYYRAHKQAGFVVIAIEDGQPVSEVQAYVNRHGLTFPVWPDTGWIATYTFGINNLPTSYVIDRHGDVRLMWVGPITHALLEQYVTPLLDEE